MQRTFSSRSRYTRAVAAASVMLVAAAIGGYGQQAERHPVAVPVAPVFTNTALSFPGFPAVAPLVTVDDGRASTGGLLAAGVLAAAVGAAGGAVLGYNILPERRPGTDDPGLHGAITGWVVGPAITVPPVVHLINGGHGSLPAAWAAAGLISATTMVIGNAEISGLAPVLVIGGPLLQAVSAVVIHRVTDRPRE